MRGPRVGPRLRRKRVRGVRAPGRAALGPRPLSARPPRAACEVREKPDTAKPSLCLAAATPPQGDAQRDAEKPERGDDARRDVGVPRVCRRVSAVPATSQTPIDGLASPRALIRTSSPGGLADRALQA